MTRRPPRSAPAPGGRDRGAALLLVLLASAALVGAALVGVQRAADGVVDHNRARTAADAAALAGAVHGRAEAERLAAANGAVLIGWHESAASVDGRPAVVVEVVVKVDHTTARARATSGP